MNSLRKAPGAVPRLGERHTPPVCRNPSAETRPAPAMHALGADAVLHLQRSAGNRAVVAELAGPTSLRSVQRRIKPEDLAGQMAGTAFQISQALTVGAVTLAVGER